MKKLMFVAAVVGSAVAFGGDVSEFNASEGVYNVTFSQKVLQPTYSYDTVEGDEITSDAWATKALALADAKVQFAEYAADEEMYPNAKMGIASYKEDDDGNYVCTLPWTYEDLETKVATGGKLVTESFAGIVVKGEFDGEFVQDGTFFLWPKSYKVNKKFQAVPVEEAVVMADPAGKKSVGTIDIPLSKIEGEDQIDVTGCGVGFGTSVKGEDDEGNASYFVKTVSGQMTFTGEEIINAGYGTWKISRDSSCSKLATAGADLETILNKKGATEFIDAE